jgi:hypothetical protein
MFIGLRMDEESTYEISVWLRQCARHHSTQLQYPLPEKFIYIPICYSGSPDLDMDELRSHIAGEINIPIKLNDLRMDSLGETGNISLIFKSDWIKDRYKFWIGKDRRFRRQPYKFKARIPMSHFCHCLNHDWLSSFPIREVRLVEEFSTSFDRREFLNEVREAVGL